MSGYLFKVSALLAVLQKQILRIGIRFGSKGFSSKLIGDLKISFDIKRKNLCSQKQKAVLLLKKSFWLPNMFIFSITDSFEDKSSSDMVLKNYTHI